MSRHCLLHIGTEKTGTTSLQRLLDQARPQLMTEGVRYVSSLGRPAHRALSIYAMGMEAADDAFRALGLDTADAHAEFRRALETDFAREVAKHPDASRWIVSSEHLHSRLETVDEVKRVRAFLAPHFDRVSVIVNLRPQIDVGMSLASTLTRVGAAVTQAHFEEIEPEFFYYDFLGLYRRWAKVFGEAAVTCVAYSRESALSERLRAMAGISAPLDPLPEPLNRALDVQTMALVNALDAAGEKARIEHGILDRLPVTEPLALDRGKAQAIQRRFDTDNAALIAACPDLQPGDLTPDWRRYPRNGNLHRLQMFADTADLLSKLVLEYNGAVEWERRRK